MSSPLLARRRRRAPSIRLAAAATLLACAAGAYAQAPLPPLQVLLSQAPPSPAPSRAPLSAVQASSSPPPAPLPQAQVSSSQTQVSSSQLPASLSLAQAQRLAVARSRQVAAQDAALTASREMAVAAGQLPDPVLKLGIDNLPVNGADRGSLSADFMTMRRVGISQELTRADKRALRSDRYRLQADKDQAEKDRVVAAIERDTAIAWLDRYYADAANNVIAAQRAQAANELQAVEAAYRGGRASQADVLAAKSSVAQFDDRIDDAARRARSAQIALARWVGDAATLPQAGMPAMLDDVHLDPATLNSVLAHHPDLAASAKQVDIAATDARLAEAATHPDWSVEVGFQQRGPAYTNMLTFGVSVPLQWDRKNRQGRELAARLAEADQARAEYDELLRVHQAEIRAMLIEWQTDRNRVSRYVSDLIPLAEERSAALLAAYRGGKATLQDVLAGRRAELDTRLSALQLEAETARLWAQLKFFSKDVP